MGFAENAMRWFVGVLMLSLSLPAVAGEEGEPGLCPPVDPEVDTIEVSQVLQEGAFRLSITRSAAFSDTECKPLTNPDGTEGWAKGVKISVVDDDGPIPGEVSTVKDFYFWRVPADSERVPVNGTNCRVSLEFTQVDGGDAYSEPYWGEAYEIALDVAVEPTPPLVISDITRDLQLTETDWWDGEWLEGDLCMMPRLGVSWGVEPDTTGYSFTLKPVDAAPDGQNYLTGLYVGESGYVSRKFLEMATEYCMTLQFNQSFTENAPVLSEAICATYDEFEAMLEDGQRFCVEFTQEPAGEAEAEESVDVEEAADDSENGGDAEGTVEDTDDTESSGEETQTEGSAESADDSEGGCQHGKEGALPVSMLFLACTLLVSRRRAMDSP